MRVNKTKFALMLALAGMTFACGGGDSGNGLPNPNKPILPGIKLNSGHKEIPANMNPNLCYMQVIEVGSEKILRRNNQADPYMSILEVSVTNPDGSPAQGSVVFRIDETQIAGLQSLNERDHLGKPAGCNYDMQVNAALSESGKAQVVLMSRGKEDISQSTPVKVYASYNGVEDNTVVFIGPANKPPQGAGLELKVLDPYLTGSGGDRPSTLFDVLVSNIGGAPAPDPQYGIDNIKLSIDSASASQGSRLRFVDERGYTRSGSTITLASRDGKASVELIGGSSPSAGQGRSVTVSAWTDTDNNVSNGISNFSPVSYTFKVLNRSSDCQLNDSNLIRQFDNDLGAITVDTAYQSENFGYPCAVAPITQLPPDPQDWNNLPAGLRVEFNPGQASFRVLGTPTQLSKIDNVVAAPVPDQEEKSQLKTTLISKVDDKGQYSWQPVWAVQNNGYPIPDTFTVKYRDAAGQVFKHHVRVVVVKGSYLGPHIGACPAEFYVDEDSSGTSAGGDILIPVIDDIMLGQPYSITFPVSADPKANLQYVITGLPAGLSYTTGKDGIVISGTPTETCKNVGEICTIGISVRDTYQERLSWLPEALIYPYIPCQGKNCSQRYGDYNPFGRRQCNIRLRIHEPEIEEDKPRFVIGECPDFIKDHAFNFKQHMTSDWTFHAHQDLDTMATALSLIPQEIAEGKPYTIGYPVKYSVSGNSALKMIGETRLELNMGEIFGNSLNEIVRDQVYTLTVTDTKGNSASKQCIFDAIRNFKGANENIDGEDRNVSPKPEGEWLVLKALNEPLTNQNGTDTAGCTLKGSASGTEVSYTIDENMKQIDETIDFSRCFLLRLWNLSEEACPDCAKKSYIPKYNPALRFRILPRWKSHSPQGDKILFNVYKEGTDTNLDYYKTEKETGYEFSQRQMYDTITRWFGQSGLSSAGKLHIKSPACKEILVKNKDGGIEYRPIYKDIEKYLGQTFRVDMKLLVSEPGTYLGKIGNPPQLPGEAQKYGIFTPNPVMKEYAFEITLPDLSITDLDNCK